MPINSKYVFVASMDVDPAKEALQEAIEDGILARPRAGKFRQRFNDRHQVFQPMARFAQCQFARSRLALPLFGQRSQRVLAAPCVAQKLAQELVDDVNRDRTRVEQIKRFVILPRDFSEEEGEVTPTLKLRRKVIHEHFADEIEKLYAG